MGLFSRLLFPEPEQRFHVSQSPPGWFQQLIGVGGWDTATGVDVTPERALTHSAVFACVRVLAEGVASLPLVVYRRRADGGKDRAPDHPLYSLLHDSPNPEMTSFELRETLMGHLALRGNGYAEIEYNRGGRPMALWPLRPDRMEVERVNGRLRYVYELPSKFGEKVGLPPERVLHLRGLGSDGVMGFSPIHLHRQGIGMDLAAQEYGARFYKNGAQPGGVLEHPGELGDTAFDNLRESWRQMHEGLENAHRVAILEEGMKYHQIGLSQEDAQYLESRKFGVTEVARIYRVPPHMIGDLDRATFSNIEHQSIEFVVFSLGPWLVRWEQRLGLQLFLAVERGEYFAEHLVEGLLRGDVKSRYEAYAVGRQNGWMSANDIRVRENMNPVEGGDVYLVPLNMVPADQVGRMDGGEAARSGDRPQRGLRQAQPPERRSVAVRRRLMGIWEGLFAEAGGRLARREANDVGNAARRYLGRGDVTGFGEWLVDFYDDFSGVAAEQVRGVVMAYAELVAQAAAEEVNGAVPEMDLFVQRYAENFGGRWSGRSLKRLRGLLESGDQDVQATVEAELEKWREEKGGGIGREESVRANGAVARMVFAAAGMLTLRWVSFGESCDYCQSLNGQVVGIDEYFIRAGEAFAPAGADGPLTPGGDVGHGPAHDGCDCMVVAG